MFLARFGFVVDVIAWVADDDDDDDDGDDDNDGDDDDDDDDDGVGDFDDDNDIVLPFPSILTGYDLNDILLPFPSILTGRSLYRSIDDVIGLFTSLCDERRSPYLCKK